MMCRPQLLTLLGFVAVAAAGNLNLKWTDCGAAHGKVSDLQPQSLTLGQKTTITGTGSTDEAATTGTFEIDMVAGPITEKYSGDMCAAKTFGLPLGTGSLKWDGIKCPIAASSPVQVPVDLTLSALLPGILQTAKFTVKMASSSGDQLVCLEIDASPADLLQLMKQPQVQLPNYGMVPKYPLAASATAGKLTLKWTDCGAAHGKVSDLQPQSLALGQKTTITGTGSIDEAATTGTFEIDMVAGPITEKFSGDMCAAKTFGLPLGTGSITWDGIKCPIAASSPVDVPVDLTLSTALPSLLQTAKFTVKMASSSGDQLVCLEIDSSPAAPNEDKLTVLV